MLTNKQLIPTVAYRLLASPLTDGQVEALHKSLWRNISLSPKDKHRGHKNGCLGLMPFQTFMRSQIYNYSIRYLN